jgi:hypothetical protein
LIEFTKAPENIALFGSLLDEKLCAVNSDYAAKRVANLVLQAPIIQQLPEGTFYEWLKSKGKLGGQNKVPRLSNNRLIIEEVIAIFA